MAISTAINGLLLDTWRYVMQEDIWRFNQVVGLGTIDVAQLGYLQRDRDMVARALSEAYYRLRTHLKYAVCPEWVTEEVHATSTYYLRDDYRLHWGHIQAIGKRASTLIEADVSITYSSVEGLGVNDTATITVTTDVAADEIAVFFRVADGADAAGSEVYQIAPVSVSKSGSTATITGHRALFVSPANYWAKPFKNSTNLEGNYAATQTTGDFVTSVDVYRVYADATQAVEVVSAPLTDGGDDVSTYISARVMNPRIGIIRLNGTGTVQGIPNTFKISYRAGYPLVNGKVESELAVGLVRLANTLMNHAPSAIIDGNAQAGFIGGMGQFQDDVEEDRAPSDYVNNVFGIRRGQLHAARMVEHRKLPPRFTST